MNLDELKRVAKRQVPPSFSQEVFGEEEELNGDIPLDDEDKDELIEDLWVSLDLLKAMAEFLSYLGDVNLCKDLDWTDRQECVRFAEEAQELLEEYEMGGPSQGPSQKSKPEAEPQTLLNGCKYYAISSCQVRIPQKRDWCPVCKHAADKDVWDALEKDLRRRGQLGD